MEEIVERKPLRWESPKDKIKRAMYTVFVSNNNLVRVPNRYAIMAALKKYNELGSRVGASGTAAKRDRWDREFEKHALKLLPRLNSFAKIAEAYGNSGKRDTPLKAAYRAHAEIARTNIEKIKADHTKIEEIDHRNVVSEMKRLMKKTKVITSFSSS